MTLIEGWMPPSRENWEIILKVWQYGFPIVSNSRSWREVVLRRTDVYLSKIGSAQWMISWYGMGKTSVTSRLNLPGRIGWLAMECPGFLTLLYIMNTLPRQVGITDLPWQNKVLAGLFV